MNFKKFMTIKVLDNRRLACWSKEFTIYNIIIKYVKGTKNA